MLKIVSFLRMKWVIGMRIATLNTMVLSRRAAVAGLAAMLCFVPVALTGCGGDASDGGGAAAEEEAPSTFDLAVGAPAELESGLTVTVDSVDASLVNYDGSAIVGVHVTYVNNSDDTADYNLYDWKGEDANGAQESCTYYSEASDDLSSGSLAAGGSVSGNLYFAGGTTKLLYFGSMFDDDPSASWVLA